MICIVQVQGGSERHRQVFLVSSSSIPNEENTEKKVIGIRFNYYYFFFKMLSSGGCKPLQPGRYELNALSVMERQHSPSASMWPDKDLKNKQNKKRVNYAKNRTVTRS